MPALCSEAATVLFASIIGSSPRMPLTQAGSPSAGAWVSATGSPPRPSLTVPPKSLGRGNAHYPVPGSSPDQKGPSPELYLPGIPLEDTNSTSRGNTEQAASPTRHPSHTSHSNRAGNELFTKCLLPTRLHTEGFTWKNLIKPPDSLWGWGMFLSNCAHGETEVPLREKGLPKVMKHKF